MKKKLLCSVLVLTFAGGSFATMPVQKLFCIVSSDQSTNNGFCRSNSQGGDECYMIGEGAKCNGTGGWD